ncbi:hypothetical protein RvY_17654 [Ramazzottius varieornatus]|uniref:Uncharacterized protein n=1 Tax=Ramazzottius varieornatus TaxID=947166 RepID=A0A1D1W2W5_RAMVA|nr:hypothetical protein RvY_17654 [Ramazzottius varieornatus]
METMTDQRQREVYWSKGDETLQMHSATLHITICPRQLTLSSLQADRSSYSAKAQTRKIPTLSEKSSHSFYDKSILDQVLPTPEEARKIYLTRKKFTGNSSDSVRRETSLFGVRLVRKLLKGVKDPLRHLLTRQEC